MADILIQKDGSTLVPKLGITAAQRDVWATDYTIYDINADGTKSAAYGPTRVATQRAGNLNVDKYGTPKLGPTGDLVPSVSGAGSVIKTARAKKVAAFEAGPITPAPLWSGLTPYATLGQQVRLSNGQHLFLTTAGTTGATEPTVLTPGRVFVDGTAGWSVGRWVKKSAGEGVFASATATAGGASTITFPATATYPSGNPFSTVNSTYNRYVVKIVAGTGAGQIRSISGYVGGTLVATVSVAWAIAPDATSVFTLHQDVAADASVPVRTTGASAAALGLTETNLSATNPETLVSGKGCVVYGTSGVISAIGYAVGPVAGSGNATAAANAAGYTGDAFSRGSFYEIEVSITDTCVALTCHNNTIPLMVEIDGQILEGDPYIHNGVSGGGVMWDFGVMAKRKVRFWNQNGVRGIALTAQGKINPPTATNLDCALILGDSYWDTAPGNAAGTAFEQSSYGIAFDLIKRLGFDSEACMNIGGSGYISQNVNTYNVINLIGRPNNQTFIGLYAPRHVFIGAGFNDATNVATVPATAAALADAMLATWRAVRALLPSAKITIFDTWGGPTGPNADHIAVSALISATFASWGDSNSRMVPLTVSAANTMISGTGRANAAVAAGNCSYLIGAEGSVHPTPYGSRFIGKFLADGVRAAWGDDY